MVHGTADTVTPYASGLAAYDRAQSVGLTSSMITMEGSEHVKWDDILTTYFTDLTTSLYEDVTKGAQAPDGCYEEDMEESDDDSIMEW